MSFSKTISTIAALASIFGAAAAGWKLAESNSEQPPTVLDQKINQLEKQLEQVTTGQQQPPAAPPETPPEPARMPLQTTPAPQVLPPPQNPPAPPAPPSNELP